jgi:hypothetical protein
VLKVQLKDKVEDHLEAPEHIGLAGTHPSKLRERSIRTKNST